MPNKSKIIILIVVLGILVIGLSLRYILALFDICILGMRYGQSPLGSEFCYMPSDYDGKLCDKQTDCGTGDCVLVNKKTRKGICRDIAYGCNLLLTENGKASMRCSD